MSGTRYRRGWENAEAMRRWSIFLEEDGGGSDRQLAAVRSNLARAIKEELTPRQREMILLYYVDGLDMPQISRRLGVNKSTVSRTIKRGERRLARCLRYGAGRLLEEGDDL